MSKYWYKKIEMPNYQQNKLISIVKNCENKQFIAYIKTEDTTLSLFKISSIDFAKIFSINRYYLYKGDFTAPAEENNYDNCSCYVTNNGLMGYAISSDGWFVSFFSNLKIKGITQYILNLIPNAKKLCFLTTNNVDENLKNLYGKLFKFSICAVTTDDEYEMRKCYGDKFVDDFIIHNGSNPHHIFMINKSCEDIKTFTNYYDAYNYVSKL